MAQKFVTPITIKQLASAGSDALTVFLNGEAYGRVKLEAGGRISWSDGTGSYDTNLYRDSANVLTTDDVLKATAGVITMAVAGTPTAPLADGALAVDTTNNTFYFRANGAWSEISGNSTITVSDTAPADAEVGALWFDSTSLEMFIYYGSAWVQLNADTGAEELSDLFDIEFSNLIAGQILKYDGEKWVNETGSSTTVSSTAPANPASGDLWYDSSTLGLFIYYDGNWVELNADTGAEELSDLIDVNLTSLTNGQVLKYNGTEWVNAADNAGTSISSINDINDVTITSPANGQVLQYNGAEWINAAAASGGATVNVSETAPADPSTGDLWFESDTAKTFIYFDSQWIEVGPQPGGGAQALTTKGDLLTRNTSSFARLAVGTNGYFLKADSSTATGLTWSAVPTINNLDDIGDVTITSVSNGQVLKWNGSAWVNAADNAGTTINSLDDVGDVTITSATNGQFLKWNGTAWVNDSIPTINTLDDVGDVTITSPSNGQFLKWNGTAWVNDAIDLGTDTTGNYVSGVSAGTGISVSHTPGEGSTATVGLDATLDNLSNVTVPSPATNDVLQWNGTAWVNVAASTVGATNLDGLSDVVISTPEEFQTLGYNGTNWVNTYSPTVTYVRNAEATTLTTGTVVYLFGATGDHATVKRADNDSDTTSSKTVGVVAANILASENGPVVTRGYVDGIDLSVGYTSGDILWLGEDGGFTKTKPSAPEHLVFVGVVVRATSNGIIYVATQNGYELDELHDVSITSPASGQFLKWNGSLWVNDAIDLGTDTTGSYVQNLVAGTGVTLANNSGESATPTVAVDTTVIAPLASPTFTGTVTVPTPTNNTDAATKQYVDTAASNAASAAEANAQAYADAITVSLADLTDGVTASAAEINILDGATLSTAELNYVDGVTSAIQTQLDAKAPLASPTFTGTATTNNLVVSGNLTVSGTTTSINTETLTVDDNIIVLNNNATGAPSENAGVEVERGSSTNVSIRWNESTDKWQFTNDGSTYVDFDKSPVTVSSTAPASPVNGQLWFYQDTAQTFIYYGTAWIEVGAVSNGARVEVSPVAPASPVTGDLWFDSDTAQTFTYYDSQWIEIGASGMAASVGDSAPASPVNGQIWFDSLNASVNIYYDSNWVEVGGGAGGSTVTISDTAPNPPTTGQLWFNSLTGATFVYYGSVWVEVGVAPFDQLLSTLDAKGDLLVGTADNTVTKLPVGSNNQVLTADSSTASGLKWSTPTTYATTGKAIAMSIVFSG